MKKYLSIILTVVMVAMLLVTLSGCSSEADKFIGIWEAEIDLADTMNAEFAKVEETADYLKVSEFEVVMVMSFNDDGTYKSTLDEDSVADAIEGLREDFADGVEKMLEDQLKKQGVNMTVEEALAASGTTIDSMLDEIITEDMIDEFLADSESEGNYKIEDGKLFLSDGLNYAIDEEVYETYTMVSDYEFTITGSVGGEDEDIYEGLYPLEFKKVG